MITGVLLGPSLMSVLSGEFQQHVSFITDIALSFVALTIGLELSLTSLKKQGRGIITVIISESFMAFVAVTGFVYLLTRDLPLALIFGAIAPASAPAGTVAVIQEYRARGKLTSALYAVVGFDDGLGIIIFGFASAAARHLLAAETGTSAAAAMTGAGLFLEPLFEVLLSLGIGLAAGIIFSLLTRNLKSTKDIFIITFGVVLAVAGLCTMLEISLILTNMVIGMFAVNTQSSKLIHSIKHEVEGIMPLIFVLFFVLAGANLHLQALPSLGLLGLVYAASRSAGLMGGAYAGSVLGKLDSNIRKYLGLGILSQAGVAIGLSLIVKQQFSELGQHGMQIGSTVITTVTATCLLFELIGPVLTKIALRKAGEIDAG
jgi:Kef-type K+ transport system membrane component KefB